MKTKILVTNRNFYLAAAAGLTFACGGVALAQKSAPPAKPAVPAQTPTANQQTAQNGDITIRFSGAGVRDNRREVSHITKDVVVTQIGEDFILNCDDIVHNEKANEAIAKGSLRLQSRDSTLTGNTMRADFDTKVITVLGNVVINSFGKGNGLRSNDSKRKPSSITCDRVDYNYRNRQAVITGNIRMKQDKTTTTCDRILFDEERNVADLQGHVIFTNTENKRVVRAQSATLWIDDDIVQTNKSTTVTTPSDRPVRQPEPKTEIKPAPKLPPDIFEEFGRTLPPAPTPSPAPADEDITEPMPKAAPSESDKR